MNYTNKKLLQNCYCKLREKILNLQDDTECTDFSFRHGIPLEQEGFKFEVWKKANEKINSFSWETPGLIGSGKIKQAVLNALRADVSPTGKSLVDWNDIIYFVDIQSQKTNALEKCLYELYKTDNDEMAFKSLWTYIGNKFALISYLFFIKDKENYAVVRPDNFAWRFQKIGVKEVCTFPCSWENYMTFMSVLREVRDFLNERMEEEVTLLDAHSFVWMLWMIKDVNVANMSEAL